MAMGLGGVRGFAVSSRLWQLLLPGLMLLSQATPAVAVGTGAPDPGGVWFTQDRHSTMRFAPCGSGWCGRVERVLVRDPGATERDVKNPDPALRNRSVLGVVLFELPRAEGGSWRGTVYDPRSGKTYKAVVSRTAPDQLEIKGCLLMFCQTQRWTAR